MAARLTPFQLRAVSEQTPAELHEQENERRSLNFRAASSSPFHKDSKMIALNITSTTPHVLIDEAATADLKRAYVMAMRDRSATVAAERAAAVLIQLVSDLAFPSIMDSAVRAAAASGRSVVDELRGLWKEISKHAANASGEIRAYDAYCAAQRAKVGPALNACVSELLDIGSKAEEVEKRIAGFDQARQRCLYAYEEAGLSPVDIAHVGLKPTHEDLALWKRQLEQTCTRKAQLNQFLQSAPEYDMSLLNVESAPDVPAEV
jgi:hypothetical protein